MLTIENVSIGVSNLEKARVFYDKVLSILGCHCIDADDDFASYGKDNIEVLLLLPANGEIASFGNCTLVFTAPSKSVVETFYRYAIEMGAIGDSSPQILDDFPKKEIYTAYMRDPFGNNIEVICKNVSAR